MTTTTITIEPADLARLTAEVAGPVLVPGDERYAEETATWNQALAHRPAVAVGATCVADVRAAVRFARVRDLPVAVVATGHGAFVPADGAVLINVCRMDGVTVDARRRTATVDAAVETQCLIDAAAEHGLAPLAGSSPNVGVVGFTLGGGLSPMLGRVHGYAADHVLAAEIVTPDGELRRVDAHHEPELFWALRGGKGNFGVVTSLTVGLFPVTHLYAGGLFFGGEHTREVLNAYRELTATAPEELTASIAFLRLPPLPFVPEPLRGRFTVHVRIAYHGTAEEGARLIAGVRAAGPALIDAVEEMPFTRVAAIHADPVDPLPAYETSALLSDFPGEALLAAAGPGVDTPALMVEIRQLGGALARDPEIPNAVGHRGAPFQLFAGAVGAPGTHDAFRPALRELAGAFEPWATGHQQINFLTGYDVTPEAVARAYPPATYQRLAAVKRAYDPRNMFRVNHNIPPVVSAGP
ncbi:FAD-linked oxidase [Paractinoplanes deccanensis]|uniref:FAD-linked oxidase n=1 Tax=Paractinoplanes deccanensis TaxID=113561 RepID=A0ABQ3XZ08_9ACTN|nr:FAD-binding oxidoreductase [Actinoplanes deccanensis]GID72892.1 FAD-linked oxidase [Actinoplanes deccanensis]